MAEENTTMEGVDAEVKGGEEVKIELTKAGGAVAARTARSTIVQDDEQKGNSRLMSIKRLPKS